MLRVLFSSVILVAIPACIQFDSGGGPQTNTLDVGEISDVGVHIPVEPGLGGIGSGDDAAGGIIDIIDGFFESEASQSAGSGTAAGDQGGAVFLAGGGSLEASNSCSGAPPVGEGTYNVNNSAATTDGASDCGGERDVWLKYRPSYSHLATITTTGSQIDAVLAVFSGCDGAELDCDDDAAGGRQARIEVWVQQDRVYFVRLAGYGGEVGEITVNIE